MNDSNNPSSCGTSGDCCKCDQLQRRFNILIWATLVIAFTTMIFFLAQARFARNDLAVSRPLLMQQAVAFQQQRPQMEVFLNKLVEYGKTHPDFTPILSKWGISSVTPAAPKK